MKPGNARPFNDQNHLRPAARQKDSGRAAKESGERQRQKENERAVKG